MIFSPRIHMILVTLLIIGGLNWGSIGVFDYNFVEKLNSATVNSQLLVSIIYVLVGVAAVLMLFDRNSYLPFLGETIIPTSISEYKQNETTLAIDVEAPKGIKVQYWAANPNSETVDDPWNAYTGYSNAGVANVKDNKATLEINCPANYNVRKCGLISSTLPKHVHYRLIYPNGMTSQIMTKKIYKC
jgi:uncharacterized membrane protein YuzA (DUF378 family)